MRGDLNTRLRSKCIPSRNDVPRLIRGKMEGFYNEEQDRFQVQPGEPHSLLSCLVHNADLSTSAVNIAMHTPIVKANLRILHIM